MDKENFLLYEDEFTKVEIDGFFHNYVKKLRVPSHKMPAALRQLLIGTLAKSLREDKVIGEDIEVVYGDSVLQVCRGDSIYLLPPLEPLTDVLNWILEAEDIMSTELKEELQILFGNQVIFGMFPYKFCDVSGYVGLIRDKSLYVVFFSYSEEEDI